MFDLNRSFQNRFRGDKFCQTIGFYSQVVAKLINYFYLFITKFHYILRGQTLILSHTSMKS